MKPMQPNDDTEFKNTLSNWQCDPKPDPQFKDKVHARIHDQFFTETVSEDFATRSHNWFKETFARPVYAVATLTLLVAGTLGIHEWWESYRPDSQSMPQMYQLVIDPTYAVNDLVKERSGFQSINDTPDWSPVAFEQALKWVEEQMDLNASQVSQFHHIHESYFAQFNHLCTELLRLENEYRSHERNRIEGRDVDLFKVYQNFQQQKIIYQQTIQLQQELLQNISTLLTPQQRGAYGELFIQKPNSTPKIKNPSALLNTPTREWQI